MSPQEEEEEEEEEQQKQQQQKKEAKLRPALYERGKKCFRPNDIIGINLGPSRNQLSGRAPRRLKKSFQDKTLKHFLG
jgi:hypothetical protein